MRQEGLSHYMNKISDPFRTRGFGDAASWIDFVNSELLDGFGNFTDMLEDPAWMRSFLQYWRLKPPLAAAPLPELKTRRSQLRRLVEQASAKKRLRIEDLLELNAWLNVASIPRLEEDQNGLRLAVVPIPSGWASVLANIAGSFAHTLLGQAHRRLKICSNDECRWIFVDTTKGNVRRWCSSTTCGNRERVRRARAGAK
jgi:predicted RNA-binding Zn ribbon-like protein